MDFGAVFGVFGVAASGAGLFAAAVETAAGFDAGAVFRRVGSAAEAIGDDDRFCVFAVVAGAGVAGCSQWKGANSAAACGSRHEGLRIA